MFYKCDPNKNTKCKKTTCYIYGGNCELTSNSNYAKDASKPLIEYNNRAAGKGEYKYM